MSNEKATIYIANLTKISHNFLHSILENTTQNSGFPSCIVDASLFIMKYQINESEVISVSAKAVAEPKVQPQAEPTGVTPTDLAEILSVSPKSLRAWLRTNYTRPLDAKNSRWYLPDDVVKAATEHYTRTVKKNEGKSKKSAK